MVSERDHRRTSLKEAVKTRVLAQLKAAEAPYAAAKEAGTRKVVDGHAKLWELEAQLPLDIP